jgi:hypothetical protein
MRAHRAAKQGGAVLLAVVVAASLAALAGAAAAEAAHSPNDIDFMGTKTEGGRRCEVFQPPLQGRYCPAGAAAFRAHGDTLFVCDYKVDRRSVAVVARYRGRRRWHTTAVNYWGAKAFNGCRTQDRNFREEPLHPVPRVPRSVRQARRAKDRHPREHLRSNLGELQRLLTHAVGDPDHSVASSVGGWR